MEPLSFLKMHGLGNDFVVLDARRRPLELTPAQTRTIADRREGVGCDQLIVIEPAIDAHAMIRMRIRNADGGEVEACGNATRCVASVLMKESATSHIVIETAAGLLEAWAADGGEITVDMGEVRFNWQDVPLAKSSDTLSVDLGVESLGPAVALSVGNPHAVFFVTDIETTPVNEIGPVIEHHAMFPERTNVGFARVIDREHLRLRVWERGAGLTRACGTGACAAAVAAARRGFTGRSVRTTLDGGSLRIEWRPDNHVRMTGPAALSFSGILDQNLLGARGEDD